MLTFVKAILFCFLFSIGLLVLISVAGIYLDAQISMLRETRRAYSERRTHLLAERRQLAL